MQEKTKENEKEKLTEIVIQQSMGGWMKTRKSNCEKRENHCKIVIVQCENLLNGNGWRLDIGKSRWEIGHQKKKTYWKTCREKSFEKSQWEIDWDERKTLWMEKCGQKSFFDCPNGDSCNWTEIKIMSSSIIDTKHFSLIFSFRFLKFFSFRKIHLFQKKNYHPTFLESWKRFCAYNYAKCGNVKHIWFN